MLGMLLTVVQIILLIGAAALIFLIWKDLRSGVAAGYAYSGAYSGAYDEEYEPEYDQDDDAPYEYEYEYEYKRGEAPPDKQAYTEQTHTRAEQTYQEEDYDGEEELYLDDVYEEDAPVQPRGNRGALFENDEDSGPFKLKF